MATKYIPPSLRKETVSTESLDASNKDLFPSLGKISGPSKIWGTKASYKTTIHNLIAYEKLTEQEKIAEAERAKSMEGWTVLSLALTKERLNEIHNKNMEKEEELENVYQDGGFYIYLPKVEIPKRTQMIINEDISDNESELEDEYEDDYITEEY